MRPFLRRITLVLALGVIGFVAVSAFFAYRFTSATSRPAGDFAPFLPATTESIRFVTADGLSLAGWFTPSGDNSRAAVLLHGNGSNRRQMLARAALLRAQGYAVLLYDARGHGESAGDRVSIGWFETQDLLAALGYLRTRGARQLGVLGCSQGGATIALAADRLGPDVRWAVLESVYPTLRDAIDCRFRRTLFVPGWLGALFMLPFAEWRLGVSADAIAPIDHVASFTCPVFLLHGEHDTHTLPASAQALFAHITAPKSLWLVPGASHNDLYGFAKATYEQRLLDFIRAAPP
ncbi:MAG: alpha/beta fold hydrolase [Verrucomicrobiota bacterium]